ncbi:MAG: hypothetical protein RBQ97_03655 [Acholeplasma sp.]|nr:hypothetical protein [Acholeplasma sp.]
MDFKIVKSKVISEIDVRNMTETKIYKFVLGILKDKQLTKNFMLSEGFTNGQLNKIEKTIERSNRISLI